ncbi:MAG: hypothetical protein WBF73_12665 [Bradyrhizobium sp.]
MAIAGEIERQLAAIDDMHSSVLVGLRVWHRAGPCRDPKRIREALQTYVDAVMRVVNGGEGE